MKISSELNIDSAHVHQLGIRALTQIVSLPEETREKKQQTSSGEMKTPYEMTNKEREEFKRQLKQRDEQNAQLQSQVEQAQRSEEIALGCKLDFTKSKGFLKVEQNKMYKVYTR